MKKEKNILAMLQAVSKERKLTSEEINMGRAAALMLGRSIHQAAVDSSLSADRDEITRLTERGYTTNEARKHVMAETIEAGFARGFGGKITRCRIGCINRS